MTTLSETATRKTVRYNSYDGCTTEIIWQLPLLLPSSVLIDEKEIKDFIYIASFLKCNKCDRQKTVIGNQLFQDIKMVNSPFQLLGSKYQESLENWKSMFVFLLIRCMCTATLKLLSACFTGEFLQDLTCIQWHLRDRIGKQKKVLSSPSQVDSTLLGNKSLKVKLSPKCNLGFFLWVSMS